MAIKLQEKIEIKIQTSEKVSVFPIVAFLTLSKDKEKAFEAFKKEQEEKHKSMEDAIEQRQQLTKKIARLSEDLEYLHDDLADTEIDEDTARELRQERRHLSTKLRTLEDELEAHTREHDVATYQKLMVDLVEDTAKFSFGMNVKEDEKSEALIKAMEEHNIKYSVIVAELGRLISDAKTKKKKRS